MIICIDFDGTIAGHAYPKIGDPNIKVLNKLIQLKKDGHKLILSSQLESSGGVR